MLNFTKLIFIIAILIFQFSICKAQHFVDRMASTGEAQISNPATDLNSSNSGLNQGVTMTRLNNPRTAPAGDLLPQVSATAAIVMDADTGEIIYQRNADNKMFPASTTKLMTLIMALEHGGLNEIVTVSQNAFGVEGSSLYLEVNDKMPLGELLEGMILLSGNDAACAVAEHCAGSVSEFVNRMNIRAKQFGATNTHFNNPHGLPDENHYTTAHDLALMAARGFQMPKFAEIVSRRQGVYNWLHGDDKMLTSENRLLEIYRGANGVKTGYTQAAGRCLVTAAKRGDIQLVAVVLNSALMWHDSVYLLDYGFANVKPHPAKSLNNKQNTNTNASAILNTSNDDDNDRSFFRMILNWLKKLLNF